MSVTFRDRYRMTVSGVPGTNDITVGSALTSFQAFESTDNGLLFDIIINDGDSSWEIAKDCIYNSGTLTRGTLVDSSTGVRLNLSSAATFAVTLLSQRTFPSTITAPSPGDAIQYNGTDWVNGPVTASYTEVVKHLVKNDAGIALTKGQAVYISGANGTNVLVKLAQANNDINSATTIGLLEQDLAVNGIGYVITEGKLTGTGGANLDTNAAIVGDPIWLSPTTAGGLLYGFSNKPQAPSHLVYLGVVTRVSATVGEIFIKVQNGYELDELHDVLITNKLNNDILTYESTTGLWKNKQLPTASTSVLGAVKVDGSSITISNGVISSSGGGGGTAQTGFEQTFLMMGA